MIYGIEQSHHSNNVSVVHEHSRKYGIIFDQLHSKLRIQASRNENSAARSVSGLSAWLIQDGELLIPPAGRKVEKVFCLHMKNMNDMQFGLQLCEISGNRRHSDDFEETGLRQYQDLKTLATINCDFTKVALPSLKRRDSFDGEGQGHIVYFVCVLISTGTGITVEIMWEGLIIGTMKNVSMEAIHSTNSGDILLVFTPHEEAYFSFSASGLVSAREKKAAISSEELFLLREHLRTRHSLDGEIWSLRHVRQPDRPVVEDRMEEADAVLHQIVAVVQSWNRESSESWNAEEWVLAEEIQKRLLADGKRWWVGNPPWMESSSKINGEDRRKGLNEEETKQETKQETIANVEEAPKTTQKRAHLFFRRLKRAFK